MLTDKLIVELWSQFFTAGLIFGGARTASDIYSVNKIFKRGTMITQLLKLLPLISGFFEDNCEMWGVRITQALMKMPDQPVHCNALSHLLEPADANLLGPDGLDFLLQNQEKIPLTDEKALKEVKKELTRLTAIKGKKLQRNLDCSAQNREIELLKKYIRECTRPNGVIKAFYSTEQKEYQRHRIAVKRMLDKAKRDCPAAYHYVKAHLQTGVNFFWSSEELKQR